MPLSDLGYKKENIVSELALKLKPNKHGHYVYIGHQ